MEKALSWNISNYYRYLGKAKSWLIHSSEHKPDKTGFWYNENCFLQLSFCTRIGGPLRRDQNLSSCNTLM